jgi:hypothetical protein
VIEPEAADIGKLVIYQSPGGDRTEFGVLVGFNSKFAFVAYEPERKQTKATYFRDLTWSPPR